MSLPLLVNGAECGPSNPLQGLSKRFDQDRGLQQVREYDLGHTTDVHSLLVNVGPVRSWKDRFIKRGEFNDCKFLHPSS